MARSVQAEALFLLLALGLGGLLGLVFDLLRPLRRRSGDALWDLLFCAAAAAAGFVFAMGSENGRLGSGELAACCAGFCLYVHVLTPLVAPLLERIVSGIGHIWIIMGKCLKKIHLRVKKHFKKSEE